ncbi:MAG: carboxy terminal-processing peptidase [Verrucomicrobiales bacterium]
MFYRIQRLLAPILSIWFLHSCSIQAADFNVVAKEMARMLQNGHYARLPYDEKLSERFFTDYITDLDPSRHYFLQSDVDEFREKYAKRLHELLITEKAMEPAAEIFERFRTRVEERVALVNDLLKEEEFTYDSERFIKQDRKEAAWPADEAAARQLWRDQIEEAMLSELLRREGIEKRAKEKGVENPLANELSPEEKLSKRYERFLRTIEDSDGEDIANFFLSAVARAYDPHTEYMSAREMDRFYSAMQNKLVGIGALLQAEDDGATEIKGIVVGGPAEKQGELQLKDRIIGVDPLNDGNMVDIMFMELDKVVELIRGEEETEVRLKVEPADGAPGETKEIVITRDEVEMKDELATGEIIKLRGGEKEWKLGWIHLPSFYADFQNGQTSCSRDIAILLTRMKKEGINGLAIDLRGNGGGSLEEVRRITGFFIGRGPVVQVKSSSGHIESKESPYREPLYDGPMVVLTDKSSASASEILAGALQDYNRAVIIGESSTFGKGTVQQPMDIARFMPLLANADRAGYLKATIQKFYRVSGSSTQLDGVTPDIVLPALTDGLEFGEEHLDHPLKHDVIRRAGDFEPFNRRNLFLPALEEKSAQRVGASKDFAYIKEDIARLKERLQENQVSLNREVRQKEITENEERRKSRNAERRERFAEMAKKDEENYAFFRLTLEDVDSDVLPEVNLEKDEQSHMRRAKDELESLNDTPEWPSGMDVVKREGLAVLTDLVDLVEASKLAGVLKKP